MRDPRGRQESGGLLTLQRAPLRSWLALAAIGTSLLAGACAPARVPLPAVSAERLPDAWWNEMAALRRPGPFRADLRAHVEVAGRAPFTLYGSLRAALPDSLRLEVQGGIQTPVLALRARPDSAQMLLHRDAIHWERSREPIEWARGGPDALARAIAWAIAPQDLIARTDPSGPGTIERGRWSVAGRMEGVSGEVRVDLEPRTREVRRLRLGEEGGSEALEARLERYGDVAGGWAPMRFQLRFGVSGPRVTIELLQPRAISSESVGPLTFLRPPRWRPAPPDLRLPLGE